MPDDSTSHFIYVISQAESQAGPVKLGLSKDPDRRLKQLQTGHATPLRVWYREAVTGERVRLYESILHRDLGHRRLTGEWFGLTIEEAIAHVQFTLIRWESYDLETIRWQRRSGRG